MTIGLDNLVYAPITEDSDGFEIFGKPKFLAKACSADVSIELAESVAYADDGIAIELREFSGGKLSLEVLDIGTANAAELTGARIDGNGVLVSSSEDSAPYVAVGFRARKANKTYRYIWLLKVKFAPFGSNFKTKEKSIEIQKPKIEGTITRLNKSDSDGLHQWKTEVTAGDAGVSADTINDWFKSVYTPKFNTEAL
jgi:phi13 family phage major tail protein